MRGIAGANLHQDVVLVVSARGRDYVTEFARVRHALSTNFEVCGQIHLDGEKWLLSTSHFFLLSTKAAFFDCGDKIRDCHERCSLKLRMRAPGRCDRARPAAGTGRRPPSVQLFLVFQRLQPPCLRHIQTAVRLDVRLAISRSGHSNCLMMDWNERDPFFQGSPRVHDLCTARSKKIQNLPGERSQVELRVAYWRIAAVSVGAPWADPASRR